MSRADGDSWDIATSVGSTAVLIGTPELTDLSR
jgi:hypothetical protein